MSKSITIEIPDDVFLGLQKNPQELGKEMRCAAAVKWYETGKISQDKAAEIAGLSRAEFINMLETYSVSALQETAEELADTIEKEY